MRNRIHLALAVAVVALAALSIVDTASAGPNNWFAWSAVPLFGIPL